MRIADRSTCSLFYAHMVHMDPPPRLPRPGVMRRDAIVGLTQNVGSRYCGQSLDLSGTKEAPSRIPVSRVVGGGRGGAGVG
jgi:hypothetical protein